MKNQALQYDSGKYYYIEDCPKEPNIKDYIDGHRFLIHQDREDYQKVIKSARIEVAPASRELAKDLIMREIGMSMESVPNGIFPVHVKVKIVEQKIELEDDIHGTTNAYWVKYAILSEPDKEESKWCDSCGKVTVWINGECENYKPNLSVTVSGGVEPKSLLYKPREEQTVTCEIQQDNGNIIFNFYADCGKFGTTEGLDGYKLTPKRLLQILQDRDDYSQKMKINPTVNDKGRTTKRV